MKASPTAMPKEPSAEFGFAVINSTFVIVFSPFFSLSLIQDLFLKVNNLPYVSIIQKVLIDVNKNSYFFRKLMIYFVSLKFSIQILRIFHIKG